MASKTLQWYYSISNTVVKSISLCVCVCSTLPALYNKVYRRQWQLATWRANDATLESSEKQHRLLLLCRSQVWHNTGITDRLMFTSCAFVATQFFFPPDSLCTANKKDWKNKGILIFQPFSKKKSSSIIRHNKYEIGAYFMYKLQALKTFSLL